MVCHEKSSDDDRYHLLGSLSDFFAEFKVEDPHLKQLAEDIYSEVEIVSGSGNLSQCEGLDDFAGKIIIIRENLLRIIRRLGVCNKDKQQFVQEFSKWHEIRKKSIESLKNIGFSIHADRRNCNISRLLGHSASLVGGGISVASAALVPFTVGLTAPLAIAGGVTTVIGSATSIGTSITELKLLKKKVEKAVAVIEEDKSSFKFLENWLITAKELSEAREAILSTDGDKKIANILTIIQNFLSSDILVYDVAQRLKVVKELVQTIIDSLPQDFTLMVIVPSLIAALLTFALILNSNRSVFHSASKTWKIVENKFTAAATIPLGVLQPVVGALIKTDVTLARNMTTAITAKGVVAILGMTLDAASIILTSIDIHKGSVSEKGEKIIKVANKMAEESEILEDIYFYLVSS